MRKLTSLALIACLGAACSKSTPGTGSSTGNGTATAGTNAGTSGGSTTAGSGGSNGGTTGTSAGTTTGTVGPGGWDVMPDAGDTGVGVNDAGYLSLNGSDVHINFAWIAANANGFVSKIDTDSTSPTYKHEVARYYSVIPVDGRGNRLAKVFGLRPNYDPDLRNDTSPSRTVIDPEKNMWVANRAPNGSLPDGGPFLQQGSVTKIANLEADCVDRNGNGAIETSHDANGDGIIDMASPDAGEFINPDWRCPGQVDRWDDPKCYDECILFTQPVGSVGSDIAARAITVGATGIETLTSDVWVGIWRDQRAFQLDGYDGHIKNDGGLALPAKTYGAVTDSAGRIWWVYHSGKSVVMVDPVAGKAYGPNVNTDCGAYGIGIDAKDRIWLAGWTGGGGKNCAARFDPATNPALPDGGLAGSWHNFHFDSQLSPGESFGRGRGIAADNEGVVWMSADYDPDAGGSVGHLVGLYADDGGLYTFSTGKHVADFSTAGTQAIGVGLDTDNNIWINTYGPAKPSAVLPGDPTGKNYGKAIVVDRATGLWQSSWSIANSLYTYSDFTGYANAHFTSPRGTYHRTFTGCNAGIPTLWSSLSWTADVPFGTALSFSVRAADTVAGLSTAETFGPFEQTPNANASPVDLTKPKGSRNTLGVPPYRYLEVTVEFSSAIQGATPVLRSLNVNWACGFVPK